jgi:hypothetical protein
MDGNDEREAQYVDELLATLTYDERHQLEHPFSTWSPDDSC